MFNAEDLKRLNKIKSEDYQLVSLYLNMDQELYSTEKIKLKLKNLLAKAEDGLSDDQVEKINDHVERGIKDRSKGIVFYIGKSEEDFDVYRFNKSFPSSIHFENNLHLTPLQKLLDEYERYCVVVLDKEKTKLFVVYLGEIEEIKNLEDYYPGKHSQGGWSQRRFEGHIENHLLEHLKNTSEMLYGVWKNKKFDRIILAGTDEITAMLEKGLHNDLKARIAGKFNIELFRPLEDILEKSLIIEEKAERDKERELISEIENNLGKGNKAVSGLRDVLNSLNDKKVMQLVIQEGMEQKGYYCKECDMLILEKDCPCKGDVYEVDLVDEMVQKAISQQAEVEFVKWEERMNKLGNIGALLRY